jgi:hypothetical protein
VVPKTLSIWAVVPEASTYMPPRVSRSAKPEPFSQERTASTSAEAGAY